MTTRQSSAGGRLRDLMVSYGSYHDNVVNKFIHIVCIPLILTSSAALLEHLNVQVGSFKLDFSFYAMLLVLLFYISLDKVAGAIALVFYLVLWRVQRYYFLLDPTAHWKYSLAIWVVSWIMQFIGHGFFEKRKPALLDNILQVFSAPMFVIVEVLFMVGWRQQLHQQCSAAISQNIREFREHAKK